VLGAWTARAAVALAGSTGGLCARLKRGALGGADTSAAPPGATRHVSNLDAEASSALETSTARAASPRTSRRDLATRGQPRGGVGGEGEAGRGQPSRHARVDQAGPHRCRGGLSYTRGPLPLHFRTPFRLGCPRPASLPPLLACSPLVPPCGPSCRPPAPAALLYTPALLSKRRRGAAEGRGTVGVADTGPARGALKAPGLDQVQAPSAHPRHVTSARHPGPPPPSRRHPGAASTCEALGVWSGRPVSLELGRG
jgi:hypothetical protein